MQRKPFAARPIGEFVKEDEAVVVDVDVRKLGVDLCRRDDHAKPLQDHHTATELIEGEPAVRRRVELCKGAIQLEEALESAQQREELAALDIIAGRAVGPAVGLPCCLERAHHGRHALEQRIALQDVAYSLVDLGERKVAVLFDIEFVKELPPHMLRDRVVTGRQLGRPRGPVDVGLWTARRVGLLWELACVRQHGEFANWKVEAGDLELFELHRIGIGHGLLSGRRKYRHALRRRCSCRGSRCRPVAHGSR